MGEFPRYLFRIANRIIGGRIGTSMLSNNNAVAKFGTFDSYILYNKPNLQTINKILAKVATYGINEDRSRAGRSSSGWSISIPNNFVFFSIIPYIKKQPNGINASQAKLLPLSFAILYNAIALKKYNTNINIIDKIKIIDIVPIIDAMLDQSMLAIWLLFGTLRISFDLSIIILNNSFNFVGIFTTLFVTVVYTVELIIINPFKVIMC